MAQRYVGGRQTTVSKQNRLVFMVTARLQVGHDLSQLRMLTLLSDAIAVHMGPQCTEGQVFTAVSLMVNHHLVDGVGLRQLQRTQGVVGDGQGAGFEPRRLQQWRGFGQARGLHHNVGITHARLPVVDCPNHANGHQWTKVAGAALVASLHLEASDLPAIHSRSGRSIEAFDLAGIINPYQLGSAIGNNRRCD